MTRAAGVTPSDVPSTDSLRPCVRFGAHRYTRQRLDRVGSGASIWSLLGTQGRAESVRLLLLREKQMGCQEALAVVNFSPAVPSAGTKINREFPGAEGIMYPS